MPEPDDILERLDCILGDCGAIIDTALADPGNAERFYQVTLNRIEGILNTCYGLQGRLLSEMAPSPM